MTRRIKKSKKIFNNLPCVFIAPLIIFALALFMPVAASAEDPNEHFDIHNARERQNRLIGEAVSKYQKGEIATKDELAKKINEIRSEFGGSNDRRNAKVDSVLSGSEADNSGSKPQTINSDSDATLKTSDPAALDAIEAKARGKNYTVTRPHKYKIHIKELDATIWVQPPDVNDKAAFEEYVKTMANDPDAFPTAGGLESTSRTGPGSAGKFGVGDPEGAALANVHKANHALKPDAKGNVDLHTAAKSLSKAAEVTGIKDNVKELKEKLETAKKANDKLEIQKIEKDIKNAEKSEFWKRVDDLRNHKTPAEAGIVDPRDPPSKQKKDLDKFVAEMNEKLKQAHFEGARQGRDRVGDLEKQIKEAEKTGDAEQAKKARADLDAVKTSNKICKEVISKSNPELKEHIKGVDEELDLRDKMNKDKKPGGDSGKKPEGDKPPPKPPDDGTKPPDDGTKPPDDGAKPSGEGGAETDDGKTSDAGSKQADAPDKTPDAGNAKTPDAGDGSKSQPAGEKSPAKTTPADTGVKTTADAGVPGKPIVKNAPPKKGAFGPSIEQPKPKTSGFGDSIKEGAMVILSGLQGGGDFSKIIKDEMHKAIKEGRDPDMTKVVILTTWEIGKGEIVGAAVGWAGGFAGSYIAGAAGAAWGGPIAVGVFVGGMIIYEVGKNGLVDGLGNITGLRPIADLIYTDWEHEFLTEEQFKHLRDLAKDRAEKQIKEIREMKKKLKTGADPKKIDDYKKLIEKTYRNYKNYIKMGGSPDDATAKALRDAIEKAGDLNSIPQDIKHGDPTFIQADREEEEE